MRLLHSWKTWGICGCCAVAVVMSAFGVLMLLRNNSRASSTVLLTRLDCGWTSDDDENSGWKLEQVIDDHTGRLTLYVPDRYRGYRYMGLSKKMINVVPGFQVSLVRRNLLGLEERTQLYYYIFLVWNGDELTVQENGGELADSHTRVYGKLTSNATVEKAGPRTITISIAYKYTPYPGWSPTVNENVQVTVETRRADTP